MTLKQIFVAGAGLMGSGIAQVCAQAGYAVVMRDLKDDLLMGRAALTYNRYDAILEEDALKEVGLDDLAPRALKLRPMDKGENRYDLAKIGEAFAAKQVKPDHLPKEFDIY